MKSLFPLFLVMCLVMASFSGGGPAQAAHKGKDGHGAHSHDPVDQEEAALMEYVMTPAYRVYIGAIAECTAPMRGMGVNGKPTLNMDREKLESCMTEKGIPVNFDPTTMKGGSKKSGQAMRDQLKKNISDIQQVLDEGAVNKGGSAGGGAGFVYIPPVSAPAPVLEVGVIAPPATPVEPLPEAPPATGNVGKSRPAGQFWVPQSRE